MDDLLIDSMPPILSGAQVLPGSALPGSALPAEPMPMPTPTPTPTPTPMPTPELASSGVAVMPSSPHAASSGAAVPIDWRYLDMPTPLGTLRIAVRASRARTASASASKTRSEVGAHPTGEPRDPLQDGLGGAWFVDDQKYLPALTSAWEASPDHAFLKAAQDDIQAWFKGERDAFRTPLSPSWTPFQEAVWRGLLGIPYGETESYAALTHRIGHLPTAVRAVAGAVGRNPISVLIPCHRVIGSDGALTGYAGGLPRKQFLLRLEQSSRQAAMPFSLQP